MNRKHLHCIVLAAALSAGVAYARAGGGGGYRSGGGSHSGGGGGGDGQILFEVAYWLLRLTFRYPVVGIPLDLAVVVGAVYFYRSRTSVWKDSPALADYRPPPRKHLAGGRLEALKGRDPSFDAAVFTKRVAGAFVTIQTEWTARRLDRVRSLTTDGVRERFQILLDLETERGLHNVMRNVEVVAVRLIDVQSDQFYDTVSVCIEARAVDYHVKSGTDEIVHGSREPEAFAEYWSFLRRPQARTGPGAGLMEGNCPSCGAGLTLAGPGGGLALTDRGECRYCKAMINSGAFDWVLAEITQTSAGDGAGRAVAGLAELTARDPAFNVQYAEDRASLMFWRVRSAELRGTGAPLVKIATPDFLKGRRGRLEGEPGGMRRFICDAAVGAVELTAVEPGTDGGEPDRLRVRIKWSGREVKARLPALIPPDFDQCRLYDEEFVLARAHAARTPSGQGLATGRCAACGAPETADAGAACASCGTPLNSLDLDWLLEDVRIYTGVSAKRTATAPADDRRVRVPEAEHVLAACVAVMKADARIDARERALLEHFARQREISPDRLEQIIRSVGTRQVPEAILISSSHKRVFLQCMLQMCAADGVISPEEEQLMLQLGDRLAPAGFDVRRELAAARRAVGGPAA